MGVIGRLDDQVNEIIIKPVAERKRPVEEEPQEAIPQERSPRPQNVTAEAPDTAKEGTQAQSDELPVWLL